MLMVILCNPQKSIQGRRITYFFPTKKKPATRGDEDGRIMPAVSESLIFLSMASLGTGKVVQPTEGLQGADQWNSLKDGVAAMRGLAPC